MSAKRRIAETLLAPLVAAMASLGARYAAKKGPELVENTLLPWLRQATSGAGDVVERVPDLARSAVSTGGDLAEGLTERVRDVTGMSDSGPDGSGTSRSQGLSADELTERSEERAKRRAQRRKATKRK